MERIRKEDWDQYSTKSYILGVELQKGDKFYLHPNCSGFVPVNLKHNIQSNYSDCENLEDDFNHLAELNGNKKVFKFDSMQEMVAWATS